MCICLQYVYTCRRPSFPAEEITLKARVATLITASWLYLSCACLFV